MGREEKQRRTDSLSTAFAQVFRDLGDGADAGCGIAPKLLLDRYEVFPQQFENLFRRRYRQGAQIFGNLASQLVR
jgi:hypothetical protein